MGNTNNHRPNDTTRQAKWIDLPNETSVWRWMHDPNENEFSAARIEWRPHPLSDEKDGWVTWLRTRGGMSSEPLHRLKGCKFQIMACPKSLK